MKRGFGGRAIRALLAVAVLCSFLFSAEVRAEACPARTAKVLSISNEFWRSNLIARSTSGGKLPIGECVTSAARATLGAGASVLVYDFDKLRCGAPVADPAHLATFQVDAGVCASYATEAVFKDSIGNVNVVLVPELTDAPIAIGSFARFSDASSDEQHVTLLAIFPQRAGSTQIRVTAFSGATGNPIADEQLFVNGFTFYTLSTRLTLGEIEVANLGSRTGPETGMPVDVIAFTAYRSGGGPRLLPRAQ
jgi:hypothetical protein